MPGKLLVIDAIASNRVLINAAISGAFYELFYASDLAEARHVIKLENPDLVLCAASLPDGHALTLCTELRSTAETAHVPFLLMSADADRNYRLRALRSGADHVFTYPLDEVALLARLRSLLRRSETKEDATLRQATEKTFQLAEEQTAFASQANVLIATHDSANGARLRAHLMPLAPYRYQSAQMNVVLRNLSNMTAPDAFIVVPDRDAPESALSLIAEVKARADTRDAAILVVLSDTLSHLRAQVLDLGAADVQEGGIDPEETTLRISNAIKQKRLLDERRAVVRSGLKAAMRDPLTGLFNRRYALPHLQRMAQRSRLHGKSMAVMIVDLDNFKEINDTEGHSTGDRVLVKAARSMKRLVGPDNLAARLGGDEFLVALGNVSETQARRKAEKLRQTIADLSLAEHFGAPVAQISASIGVALLKSALTAIDTLELLKIADRALYAAKEKGRNQVVLHESLSRSDDPSQSDRYEGLRQCDLRFETSSAIRSA